MVTRPSIRLVAIIAALALIAGCQNGEPVPSPPEPEPPPLVEEEAMRTDRPSATSLEDAVATARQDLAERLETAPETIEVVQARQVTWRNGALGCPEEDMMYTQALVDGLYILLEADGTRHAYHAGRDGVPFPCPPERSEAPAKRSDPVR